MRQALVTKYLPATECRGARVKAKAQAGSVTVGWDHALNSDENHKRAAAELCKRFGWKGELEGYGAPDGCGNVYVIRETS